MKFQISSTLEYFIQSPSTIILNIHALQNPSQVILEESFSLEPNLPIEELTSQTEENRLVRLETGSATTLKLSYKAIVDIEYKLFNKSELFQIPIAHLDKQVISYLYPSRYCQSDRLGKLAHDTFGSIETDFDRVVAISDWIYKNVTYLSGSTNSETSAFDTITQRAGVCRDFAHLGIALCRALSIPARYFSGYSYLLSPPDFHACFEVYLGGKWIIFDPTRLAPLNGLVKIATGRDAADASIATIFGEIQLTSISVENKIMEENFEPFLHNNPNMGLCLN